MPDGRERSANKNFNLPNTDESAAECKHDSLAPKSAQSNALERDPSSERRSPQPWFRHVDMTAATNSRRTVDAARFRRHFNRPCSADARQLRT